jgi:hypothetical protein
MALTDLSGLAGVMGWAARPGQLVTGVWRNRAGAFGGGSRNGGASSNHGQPRYGLAIPTRFGWWVQDPLLAVFALKGASLPSAGFGDRSVTVVKAGAVRVARAFAACR